LAEVLRHIPLSADPNLLVGIENSDDAGVFMLSPDLAIVQTIDFFTPIVDDPYDYGAIAAANALSDVYAMGGLPRTVLNIACFSPDLAPAEVWAQIIQGMLDKSLEAGAVVIGGHTIDDKQPKFGMAVTGVVNPRTMFVNTSAKVGDAIYLTKPLGTGIITTAMKADGCDVADLRVATDWMRKLNREARDWGVEHGVRCATDITGFGLGGHLYQVARASGVRIRIAQDQLPMLPHVKESVAAGFTTEGGERNRRYAGLESGDWRTSVIFDPQTSGGLALFCEPGLTDWPEIGRVVEGDPGIELG
jgi:selenide,water dikinase